MKKLPEVYFKGKVWYIDERLKEIRDTNNPRDKISFEDIQYLFFELFDKYHKQEIQEALMEGVESGRAEILEQIIPYMFLVKKGSEALAKAISKR